MRPGRFPGFLFSHSICRSADDQTEGDLATHLRFPAFKRSRAVEKATILIGRESELNKLVKAIEALKAGETFVGFVEGEAGIGKSTLIRQWSQAVELAVSAWSVARRSDPGGDALLHLEEYPGNAFQDS